MPDVVKHLQIGDVLQLQFAPPSENQDRFAATLVGFLPGQSLVITTPRKQGNPIIVREGQTFTVRMLQGSNIFGFVANVLSASSKPYPHLHLAYPADVESAVVRNAPRVATEIQAIVNMSTGSDGVEDQRPVMISDISSTGARVMDRQQLGEVGTNIQVIHSLSVCGGQDLLKVMGVIRNIREVVRDDGSRLFVHGVEYRGLTRFQELLLCAYVLGSIARERG
ncbi:MAG: flagellar brake protein [Candidatus Thiodiazotropha sp. (ex Notomyrtea botanica)]|nr:flagellar brake protein [Candidatus Thiodiazotropha sp. (ex Myrtea spinifera)]MCU7811039.1 flagellar brake protein [Candidatus Thiodiazotropha sp. (ex Notomyrtea botanica)]